MTVSRSERSGTYAGTIVFDLDGVVYLESSPIPGAAATIARLVESGWQVLYATNNSTKTSEMIAETLRSRVGVTIDPGSVSTSATAAAVHMAELGIASAMVVGPPALEDAVALLGIVTEMVTPDAVVVGLDRSLTYDKIAAAARALHNGARFIATNTDATIPTPQGEVPGAGTVVAAIATASGRPYIACGKPNQPMLNLVSEKIEADRVIMVGDRPETDIAFAKLAGWESVLAMTGVIRDLTSVPDHLTPDRVVQSIADVEGILRQDRD